MSKAKGDKEAVFRTTQVRTKLRGDSSWLQRRSEPQAEATEEKPWIAEVRASRVNGAPLETSPVSSPTKSTPPPTKTDTERAPTSGYLIRGVFTKLDKPASSSASNGYSGTTQIVKKPTENYKKIAPYTVRSTSGSQEGQLSQEEQEKRTEAASSVLKKSAVKQRSYVFSAAKKYESKEEAPDTNSVSFVAKRVEITDDDESAATPAPASALPISSVAPVTSVTPVPQPRPRRIVDASVKTAVDVTVDEPAAPKEESAVPKEEEAVAPKEEEAVAPKEEEAVAPKEEEVVVAPKEEEAVAPKEEEVVVVPKEEEAVAPKEEEAVAPKEEEVVVVPKEEEAVAPKEEAAVPEPVKEDPAPVSVTEKDPFEDMTPGCTKVATPLPVLLPEYVQAVYTDPEPEDSPLVELAPALPTPMSPTQASPVPASPTPVALTPLSPTPVSPAPLSPAPVSAVTEITVKSEPKPELSPSSGVDTLTALSDTLISFDTSSSSFKDDEPVLAEEEEGGSADACTIENGVEQEPAPEHSNCVPMTDDLLALSDGPEAPAEPVPPSPGRWSQDLLGELDSELNPEKTSSALDLLADDVIGINTEARSLSMQQEEEKQTDETAKETQSPTETVTITTKTVIITDKSEEDNAHPWSSHVTTAVTESSSADPFDPYPIGTTSPNSSVDLLQPSSDISINRVSYTFTENEDPSPETTMSSNALESLADDVIPIDTDTTRLSTQRSWTRTWETSTPQQADTEESQDAEPQDQTVDQKTVVMFERKSTENDSPWDRWTSPTVYTITTEEDEEEEEEEEEESPEDTQTQTVTTITTIREMHSEPEPAMDRYETYSRTVIEEDQRVHTPEPEAKKPFVYVKEYVNATELSLHNARDAFDGASDYLTSTSTTFSYSSPSIYSSSSLSSTCTYCGGVVGNDAKISIEHLNINCHPACFLCAVCSKPMGDLLDSMFLHGGKVHCENCYSKAME